MSYSSSALTSSLNRSLYFDNILSNIDSTVNILAIGSFESSGYFKVTLMTESDTIILEISQGKIISVQSSSKRTSNETFGVKLVKNDIIEGYDKLFISNILNRYNRYKTFGKHRILKW